MEHAIIIDVKTQYLPEHEAAKDGKFVFAYHVTIRNLSDTPCQLLERYWLVTDGNGKQSEVSGPGVIGQQPKIAPGDEFQYTSGVVIDTPVGSMQGYYKMQTNEKEIFDAPIDVFSLAIPQSIH